MIFWFDMMMPIGQYMRGRRETPGCLNWCHLQIWSQFSWSYDDQGNIYDDDIINMTMWWWQWGRGKRWLAMWQCDNRRASFKSWSYHDDNLRTSQDDYDDVRTNFYLGGFSNSGACASQTGVQHWHVRGRQQKLEDLIDLIDLQKFPNYPFLKI